MAPAESEFGRKRKAHTKSRQGCGNCKLRRVKCDETKPQCNKCLSYGVSCNYEGQSSDELQLSGESAFMVEIHKPFAPPTPPSELILGMLNHQLELHDTDEVYQMAAEDVDLLLKFQNRTVLTLATSGTVHIYRDAIVEIGCKHSFLTHITLLLVLMHDRYLSENPLQAPSVKESFHQYHGIGLFSRKLREGMQDDEKDAMWGAAALLGAVTMASIEATCAEEAWPLKEDSASDLDWLRMGDGKREVWRVANPLREDSIWRDAMHLMQNHPDPEKAPRNPALDQLYPFLTRLYSYDESAKVNGDPYYNATSILVRLLPLRCTHANIMYFLSFMGHMEPAYRSLLHQKDPKAMLLLAWWYAKMLEYPVWWITRRAKLECRSICAWLGRRFIPHTDIGQLLDFPKMACGLPVVHGMSRYSQGLV